MVSSKDHPFFCGTSFVLTKQRLFKEMAQKLKTKITVIPGGLTCQLQPLHVSINKSLKVFTKEELYQRMRANEHDLTPTGRLKRLTIVECANGS